MLMQLQELGHEGVWIWIKGQGQCFCFCCSPYLQTRISVLDDLAHITIHSMATLFFVGFLRFFISTWQL